MAGSSSTGFPWTPQSIEIALDTVLKIVRQPNQPRDDPFKENNLNQAVSKLNERTPRIAETAPLRYVTANDLKALLEDRRQLYHRVCDLANHPSVLGFSSSTFQIMMLRDRYATHIQAFPEDKELIDKPIPNFFYLFMLFGAGVMPGQRRTRGTTSNRTNRGSSRTPAPRDRNQERQRNPPTIVQPNTNDNDDDDFMPRQPPRPRPPSDSEDEDEAFMNSREINTNLEFLEPPRRRQSSNPYSMDLGIRNMYRRYNRMFPPGS